MDQITTTCRYYWWRIQLEFIDVMPPSCVWMYKVDYWSHLLERILSLFWTWLD